MWYGQKTVWPQENTKTQNTTPHSPPPFVARLALQLHWFDKNTLVPMAATAPPLVARLPTKVSFELFQVGKALLGGNGSSNKSSST
jgi:hypothetical protein